MAANNLNVPLILAKTADTTVSPWVRTQGMSHFKVYVVGNGTISTGAVTIQEAWINPHNEAAGYSGTPDDVGSAITAVTDSQVAATLTEGPYAYLRAKISTGVTGGGTVSVYLVASQ